MLCRCMNSLAKLLLDSNCAATWVGPKMRSPRRVNPSTTPSERGSSGPTTVMSGCNSRAAASKPSRFLGSPGTHVASRQMPPFPGRQNTCATRGDWRSFHTSACSRPPLPITRTFINETAPSKINEVLPLCRVFAHAALLLISTNGKPSPPGPSPQLQYEESTSRKELHIVSSAQLTPEQAKFVLDQAIPTIKTEPHMTKRLIESIPLAKASYRPDSISKTALELAWHIVASAKPFANALAAATLEFTPINPPDAVQNSADIAMR